MRTVLGTTRRGFSAGLVVGAFAAKPLLAQAIGSTASASSTLGKIRETLAVPAVSAAVVRSGELIWYEAQGQADIELRVPAQPAHRFRLGSVSKVVTVAIGARLSDAGVVDLDVPIGHYRTNLPAQHRETTLRQLYSHRGGVRHYVEGDLNPTAPGGTVDNRIYRTTDDALAIFINDPLVAAPGTAVNYSTFGYTLISAVLESASGKSFLALLKEQVIAPLELTEFAADEPMALVEGRVRPYDPGAAYKDLMPVPAIPVVNAYPINPAYKWAGGGMVSSARDLARVGAAHLNDGYLTKHTRDLLFTPITARTAQMPPLGLGWRIDNVATLGNRLHHAGNIQGGRAQIALYPDHGMAIALMSNLGGIPQDIASYADTIAEAFR